jgi:hypothetical protein
MNPPFFPLFALSASLSTCDKRGEARVEKHRSEERPHDDVPAALPKVDERSDKFAVKRDEQPKVEAIDVFPITVTGSDLIARHGKRSAALIP